MLGRASRCTSPPRACVDYESVLRLGAASPLVLEIDAPAGPRVRVTLTRGLARDVELRAAQPAPEAQRAVEDGLELAFAARAGARTTLRLELVPLTRGALAGGVAVDDAAPLELRALVLP